MTAGRRVRFQPCVYVVAARDFRVKVGVSALLPRRLAQLAASEGEALAIVRQFDFPTMQLARCVEAAVKSGLAAQQIEGEWFRVLRSDAVTAVEAASAARVLPDARARASDFGDRIRNSQSEDVALMKAARRLLGWTIVEFAAKSRASAATIKNIERGATDPRASTLRAIQAAFEAAGLQFVDAGDTRSGGRGVRFRSVG